MRRITRFRCPVGNDLPPTQDAAVVLLLCDFLLVRVADCICCGSGAGVGQMPGAHQKCARFRSTSGESRVASQSRKSHNNTSHPIYPVSWPVVRIGKIPAGHRCWCPLHYQHVRGARRQCHDGDERANQSIVRDRVAWVLVGCLVSQIFITYVSFPFSIYVSQPTSPTKKCARHSTRNGGGYVGRVTTLGNGDMTISMPLSPFSGQDDLIILLIRPLWRG